MAEFNSLIELLEDRCRKYSDKKAFVMLDDDGVPASTITFHDLFRNAAAIAARLQSLGASGGRAVLLYPQGVDFVCAFFGAICAGVTPIPAVPPHSRRTFPHLLAIIQDAQPDLILSNSSLRQRLGTLADGGSSAFDCRVLETDSISPDEYASWKRPAAGPDSLALLQYTSGSTSAPRGVRITHGNVLHNLSVIRHYYELTDEDVIVNWLPHYHDMGLIAHRIMPVWLGITTWMLAPAQVIKSPQTWLKAISDFKATFSGGPNFIYQLCVDRITEEQLGGLDLSSWACAFNGAEPVRDSTLQAFVEKFAACGFAKRSLSPAYGMAEATLIATAIGRHQEPKTLPCDRELYFRNTISIAAPGGGNPYRAVSCGAESPLVPLAIRDKSSGSKLGPLSVGEICIGGASVSSGYYNSGTMTKVRFDGDPASYLTSGDLGFLDEQGHVYITGRIKDVIIVSGACFHPQDLEQAATKAHPALAVDKCIAFSAEMGDSENVVVACEVDRKHVRSLELSDVVHAVARAIQEEYGIDLHQVVLLPPGGLLRTSSGKLQRAATRSAFLAGQLDPVHVWTAPPRIVPRRVDTNAGRALEDAADIEQWLVERLTAYLSLDSDQIDPEEHLACYGVDSTMGIQLLGDLSLVIGEKIDPTLLWEHGSIAGLSRQVSQLLPTTAA
jgi:acyl-CoA synthetase (AMP-forming)/AMP-acid ligase II/acyl carrier protein